MNVVKRYWGLVVPLVVLTIFVIFYTTVWNRSAERLTAEIERFAEREVAAGRQFAYGSIDVQGYPLSLGAVISDVNWDSNGPWAFAAEEVALVTLPYDASRVLLAPRGEMAARLFGRDYDVQAGDLRLSIEREFVAAEAHEVLLTDEAGEVALRDLVANRQKLRGGESVAFSMQGLRFPAEEVTLHTVDVAGSRIQGGLLVKGLGVRVASDNIRMPTELVGEGEVTAGRQDGLLNGEFSLTLQREEAMIDALTKFGVLNDGSSSLATNILGLLTSKGQEPVELPLTVRDGRVRLGSLPLGELPPVTAGD
jgi:hypothetical protein